MLDSTLSPNFIDAIDCEEVSMFDRLEDINELDSFEIRKTAKTIVVPKIQSMQRYILKHHKRLIVEELNRQLTEGTLLSNQILQSLPKPIRLMDCSFGEMTFWRIDSRTLLVDVSICVNSNVNEEQESIGLYCELWVDMREDISFVCGECGLLEEKPKRKYWLLSSYLVPILRKEDIEKGAEELLLRYCPNAVINHEEHTPYTLASRMGLSVQRLPLYKQSGILSMLFFRDGSVKVCDEKEDDGQNDGFQEMDISAGTILINTNAVHKDYCQLEIYHECIHYDWHYMFFRLQDMHNSDVNALQTKRITITSENTPEHPVKWMEWQARRGSFSLMMPLGKMRSMIERLDTAIGVQDIHAGKKFDRLARTIARECGLPKFRVRARLIQLGYIAAQGALNYVDGMYIEPFAFSCSSLRTNHSFVIDRESVYTIYKEDKEFRKQIQSGRYVYVDGHVCLNDNRYIRVTQLGVRLTPWANAHVDECCLRFVHIYEQSGIANYRFGTMNSDEEYNKHYFAFADEKNRLSDENKFAAMTRILDSMPNSFHGALTYLMNQAHITIEMLEERSGISGRTISRLRTEENREYSIDQVIAICIGLHLPPWLSRGLIERAGYVLRNSKQHQAYQFVLDCLFMDSVDDVQRFLETTGCKKLKLAAYNAGKNN